MATKLQIRNDTAENWVLINPILKQGEIGYESTTKKIKFGDGLTEWNKLPYLTVDSYDDSELKEEIEKLNKLLEEKSNISDVYTKEEIEELNYIDEEELISKNYMAKDEALDEFYTKEEIKKKLKEYVTDEELLQKDFATNSNVNFELATKVNKSQIATVALTGSYDDLINKPTELKIKPATRTTLGGIKVGANLNITEDGVLNAVVESGEISSDYNVMFNKPKINNIELSGNLSLNQLGIQPAGNYALKSDIKPVPTKLSELTNDSGFITSIPSEYITETELNNTLNEQLEDKIDEQLTNQLEDKLKDKADKSTTLSGYGILDAYTKKEVDDTFALQTTFDNYLTKSEVEETFATKEELNSKANISDIPTNISELNNDSGFISDIPEEYITENELKEELKNYTTTSQINSKFNDYTNTEDLQTLLEAKADKSQLNDYATKEELNDYATVGLLTNGLNTKADKATTLSGYDISDAYTKTEIDAKFDNIDLSDLSALANKQDKISDLETIREGAAKGATALQEVPDTYATKAYVSEQIANIATGGDVDLSEYATKEELSTKADKIELPTKVSELENDSGFITSIPSEYVTESELENELSGYVSDTYFINAFESPISTTNKGITQSDLSKLEVGIAKVETDDSLNGLGTSSSPLKVTIPVPTGGTAGQVLTKGQGTNEVEWADSYVPQDIVTESDLETALNNVYTKEEINEEINTINGLIDKKADESSFGTMAYKSANDYSTIQQAHSLYAEKALETTVSTLSETVSDIETTIANKADNDSVNTISNDVTDLQNSKLDKNLGAAHQGKWLTIDENGDIIPDTLPAGGEGSSSSEVWTFTLEDGTEITKTILLGA